MSDLDIYKVSETAQMVTIGWSPPVGAQGYVYLNAAGVRLSSTLDGSRTTVKVAKSNLPVTVRALRTLAEGVYPPVVTTPAQTVITDAPALGLNVLTKTDVADYLIDGTGETGVLFQGTVNGHTADGSTIRRVTMKRVATVGTVPYGMHGIYGKATGLLGEDVTMDLSANCADGLSARFPSTWRRFKITGAHQHAITYYETGAAKGTVLFEDFDGTFNNPNAAVWVDRESNYQALVVADLVFRRVHLTGPSTWFLASYDTVFKGSVTLDGCTLNGAPVTSANVRGVGTQPVTIT